MTRQKSAIRPPSARVWGYMLGGCVAVVALVAGFGLWAVRTEIAGAVLATGVVVVESNVKKVQHPTGGVVGEIRVKDGDKVNAGDLLLRLDDTVMRANLQMVVKHLDELMVRETRLKAERDGADTLDTPRALSEREQDGIVGEMLDGERSLFHSRRDSREGQKAQLRERINQLNQEIEGLTGQVAAKQREIELIGNELASLTDLEAKRLVTSAKMVAMRREVARLDGEYGQLNSSVAQARGKIAEIELAILRVDHEMKAEVAQDLRDNQAKQAELIERRIAAEDQLRRVDIRAPWTGTVHQLSVHTVGGVVNAGEPIMLIVPGSDRLVIDARIAPSDIDQVLQAQEAYIRFAAFNRRTTPEIKGVVLSVSADLTRDERTGDTYFIARIEPPQEELARLASSRIVPGMPADVYIRTENRTPLSYLVKPLEDQMTKAFRER